MDRYFRPSLTDLTRHAFKVEAKRIAEGVKEVEEEDNDRDLNFDGAVGSCGVNPRSERSQVVRQPRQETEARECRATLADSTATAKKEETLTDLTLPPRVRIIKEWGEREK